MERRGKGFAARQGRWAISSLQQTTGFTPASPHEPGAAIYNCYLLLSQILSLYAEAARVDKDSARRAALGELADGALQDIGTMFQLWEGALSGAREGQGVKDDPALGTTIIRACQRLHVLVQKLNLWVPSERWLRVLILAESRWLKVATRLAPLNPSLEGRLKALGEAAKNRLGRLSGLHQVCVRTRDHVNGSFATGSQAGKKQGAA